MYKSFLPVKSKLNPELFTGEFMTLNIYIEFLVRTFFIYSNIEFFQCLIQYFYPYLCQVYGLWIEALWSNVDAVNRVILEDMF